MLLIDELRDALTAEPRDHQVAFMLIVALGVVVRALYLAQPVRYDEAVTYVYFARLGWADALSTYTYPNNHLFHTALVKASVAALGNSPVALRIPAFAAGIALPVTTYAMVRALYDGRIALLASALVSASGALILYSTNARGYSIVALAFTLLTLQAARLRRAESARGWLTFSVIAVGGAWTIPVMLYPLGAVALWFALNALVEQRPLRRLGIALALIAIATVALYVPVISREGLAAITRNQFVTPVGWFAFLGDLPRTWREALSSWSLGVPPLAGLVLLACATLGLVRHREWSRTPVGLPLAAFVWCSWLLVVNHRAPFARTWLWLLPLAAALAAAGVLSLRTGWAAWARLAPRLPVGAAALAMLLASSIVVSRAVPRSIDTGTFADAEVATERLARLLQPGDRILAPIPANAPLMYYMQRRGLDVRHLALDERQARRVIVVVDAAEGHRLESVIARSVVRDTTQFGGAQLIARFPSSTLILFQRRNAPAS